MKIWKYPLDTKRVEITAPYPCEPIHVGWQDVPQKYGYIPTLYVWVMVRPEDDHDRPVTRRFQVVMTGEETDFPNPVEHLGSAESSHGIMAHVFKEV